MLIKKAVAVRKHLERNKKDKDSKVGHNVLINFTPEILTDEVPSYSHRVAHSPSFTILQERRRLTTYLEIRECDSEYSSCMNEDIHRLGKFERHLHLHGV